MSTEAVTSTGWLAQESSTQARVLKQPLWDYMSRREILQQKK